MVEEKPVEAPVEKPVEKPVEPVKEAPKEKSLVEEAKEERILMEKAQADMKAENDRTEKLMAERALGGRSTMSAPVPKKVETDVEYAERLNRGEANPLKEDGYI